MIQIKTQNVILLFVILLCLAFGGGWLLGRYERNKAHESFIDGLNGVIRTYIYKIGELERQAYEKDAVIMSQQAAIREGLILKEELKKLKIKHLNEVTKLQATVEILLDSISHTGTIVVSPCPPDENHSVLYLPLQFHEKNKFLDLKGEFDENANLSMDIKVPISLDMWVGYDKITKNIKGVATIDNPYVKIDKILTIKTDLQPPRRWGIGIVGGYGIPFGSGSLKTVPFVGIGLSYNFIRF